MGYIVLHNNEPEKGRARYYALTWSRALGGQGWAVERAWGPLRSRRRQHKTNLAVDRAAAQELVTSHFKRRLSHGYVVVEADGPGRHLIDRHREENE